MIEQCIGCAHWIDDKCVKYLHPEKQHSRTGGCALRSHNKTTKSEEARSVDPLKVSKKKAAGIK